MHMADALVSPAVAGTMYAVSAAAAGYSIYKVKKEDDVSKIPVMGVMGAFVFAAQMINFTIPGTGSSGHLCGGMLLSALLGPYAGFLTMIGVLFVQCLMFADGGLLEHGILRMFYRFDSDMEIYNEKWCFKEKDYDCFNTGLCYNIAAWCVFCDA